MTVLFRGNMTDHSEPRYLSPPPEHIEYFHLGFRESMADSIWLRWIQDSDICQTYRGAEPATLIVPNKSEVFFNPRHKYCDNSWSFKMLDAVTKLAPYFKMPYLAGAIALSVQVEDYEGAKIIFDRGVAAYPHDWHLLYEAAYHYLFDRQNLPRAAELLIQAGHEGAPSWVNFLASRLYTKSGQMELALSTLENYKKSTTDEKSIATIDKHIQEIRRQAGEIESRTNANP